MLYDTLDRKDRNQYKKMLAITGSLSRLFSNNDKPYIPYRMSENIFCKYLNADNLSRSDITADAKKDNIGVGIKTWLGKPESNQKIAEFDKDMPKYINLKNKEKITSIAELRNDRIDFTKRSQELDQLIYHCILRTPAKISIYECPLDLIDIPNIKIIDTTDKTLKFNDGKNEYSFNISKSTLFKRFNNLIFLDSIDVNIFSDPFQKLMDLFGSETFQSTQQTEQTVYLPLYSYTKKRGKFVPPKNNLNMRFAGGRKRDLYEVGIPIPIEFRRLYPNFFVQGSFNVELPNHQVLNCKQCQQGGKSLMSNPNKALGHWLIDDVLRISPKTPITYEMLEKFGIDCVQITKTKNHIYKMNFGLIGNYEEFINQSMVL